MAVPFLTHARIRELAADPRMYARGEKYFAEGQVTKLERSGNRLTARVEGTDTYRVSIAVNGNRVSHSCTCPVGDDGLFCKHCVAAALAAVSEPAGVAAGPSTDDWLRTRSRDELLEIIAAARRKNPEFSDYVDLLAESSQDTAGSALFDKLEKALRSGGSFVNWERAAAYSRKIHQIVDSIEDRLRRNRPETGDLERIESAIRAAEKRLDAIDDSDGHYHPVIGRLEALHLKACGMVRPEPVPLARRLLKAQLASGWETFDGALEKYAGVLGPGGIREYARLAEAEWKSLRPVGPEGTDPGQYGRRSRLEGIMLELAERNGGWKRQAEIISRDLSAPHQYQRIIDLCLENRDRDGALQWARRCWDGFPEERGQELAAFLCDEYFRRRQPDESMAVAWEMFTAHPGLESYRFLKTGADRIRKWGEWRERAWDHLQGKAFRREYVRSGTGRSVEVEILLWEGRSEEAWAIANAGGCFDFLWKELARARAKTHPDDSLQVYQRLLEQTLRISGNDSYRTAVGLLHDIRKTLEVAGREDDFIQVLASVKTAHKAKRNLMKMIDAERWE